MRDGEHSGRAPASMEELDPRVRGSGPFRTSFSSLAPVYFLTRRGIGVTPTCSSAVYGACRCQSVSAAGLRHGERARLGALADY